MTRFILRKIDKEVTLAYLTQKPIGPNMHEEEYTNLSY